MCQSYLGGTEIELHENTSPSHKDTLYENSQGQAVNVFLIIFTIRFVCFEE